MFGQSSAFVLLDCCLAMTCARDCMHHEWDAIENVASWGAHMTTKELLASSKIKLDFFWWLQRK
jgi:hypothetical protein